MRIVIKTGTNLIADQKGLRTKFLKSFVKQVSFLYGKGHEILIVSSGAIGSGIKRLGFEKKFFSLPEKQAVAAVGQVVLMQEYKKLFRTHGIPVGQILLDHDDVKCKEKNINARNTINKLLEWRVIPIINENDTVATEEIKFGDNDALAGIVAGLISADRVVILTNVDGVFTKNPKKFKDAEIVSYMENVHELIKKLDLKGKTDYGTGGMLSKLQTAKNLNYLGIPLVITNGNRKNALANAVERSGDDKGDGTFIQKKNIKLEAKKKWILTSLKSKGSVKIDKGAEKFIIEKGKSLLPVGVKECTGDFVFGDAVDIMDEKLNIIGKGITNYSAADLCRIKGKRSAEIKKMFKEVFFEEVIHRDNMFLYQ
ncbi:MAG: glutamate 5-kinase [Candidatus Goldiibacteriota bacterium]